MTYPFDSIDFITRVWKDQGYQGYGALSTKEDASIRTSEWRDYTFPLDDSLPKRLEEWFLKHPSQDKYFCPLTFSGPRRSKDLVNPSVFLWSDIDEGSPDKCKPTILWETSPGRFAGLWKVRQLDPQKASDESRQMARFIGGDKGGHDLTQVLRIPGTHNGKYPNRPIVKLIEYGDALLRRVPQSTLDRWRASLPKKLLRIIEGPAEQGKRSDMLWYLEHEMCDLGVPIKDVFSILRDSAWNKYRERGDEDERFSAEMEKIREARGESGAVTKTESVPLNVISYDQLMRSEDTEPGWMIEGFWMKNSHGIIAGQPKSFKSTLCMDMLFSVATGHPFLGAPVHQIGPVLVIQNENADWIMKDRLVKLNHKHKMLGSVVQRGTRLRITWPKGAPVLNDEGKPTGAERPVPIYFINQQSFMLDDADNKQALEELIATIRPVAINLDPLYLMFGGDVNSAKDLAPVLQWCLYIKQKYRCSVILVHHYGKGGEERRGGQRMLGSATLHGWIESAWYLDRLEPEGGSEVVSLECEFRGAAGRHMDVAITMSDMGTSTSYDSEIFENTKAEDDILAALNVAKAGLSAKGCHDKIGGSIGKCEKTLAKMLSEGKVKKAGNNYVISAG